MKRCLPDEYFNTISVPEYGTENVGVSNFVEAIVYKVPMATDVLVKREVWHTICDFCERTGALVEKQTVNVTDSAYKFVPAPVLGTFKRFVGFDLDGHQLATSDVQIKLETLEVSFPHEGVVGSKTGHMLYSVTPFINNDASDSDGVWDPTVPGWFQKKYERLIMNGALFRIYSMHNRPWFDLNAASMHAVAYNNDIDHFAIGLLPAGMRRDIRVSTEDIFAIASKMNRANGGKDRG